MRCLAKRGLHMPKQPHSSYLQPWISAMRYGLLDGRPFSEVVIGTYSHYAAWFLKEYEGLSLENLQTALTTIPVVHFAKRQKLFQALSCLAKFLVTKNALETSFIQGIKRLRPRRHLPARKFSVDQAGLDSLLNACKDPLDHLIVILLSQTGLRATEAISLKLDDLNLEKRILTVRQAKWGKSRRIGLSSSTIETLQAYLPLRPSHPEGWVFINVKGQQMQRHGLLMRLRRLSRLTGIKVTPHALRRAFVTINANKGRPLAMLQIACGHSDITTTRSYCMTTEDEAIEAMQGWD